MNGWALVYRAYVPEDEKLREALSTLGNGYLATRGASPETPAGPVHYPGTYLAGIYDRSVSTVDGRVLEDESMVNAPNWLPLTFRRPGERWFTIDEAEVLSFHAELDLRRGVLTRLLEIEEGDGRRTRVTQRRFVHMAEPHLAGLETTIAPLNWSGSVDVRSGLDGRVHNTGVERYRALRSDHLTDSETGTLGEDTVLLTAQTRRSRIRIALAARTRVTGESGPVDRGTFEAPSFIASDLTIALDPEHPVTVEKIVAIHTSRDRAIAEPEEAARVAIAEAGGFDELLASHVGAWAALWERFDLTIEGNERAELVQRLHLFHLLQTLSKNTIGMDVGVPARGLHGEAYRGHIFWDELFVYPLLNLRMPDLTRSLLGYRYRRLPAARRAAASEGHAGAMFPWQSGSDGREESPAWHLNPRSGHWLPDHSRLQRHVGLAVAYNAWQHYQVTGDREFLAFMGTELIVEVARFFTSIATYDRSLDRYEIRGVMGPDEYHDAYPGASAPGVNDNTYTNVLAAWVMCRALDALEHLPPLRREELWHRLGLSRAELDGWDSLSRKMRVVFHADGVILSQFEGYEDLEEFDWNAYRSRYRNIRRLDRILEAEGDTTNRYKVSKQADVLMLFYLFSGEELRALFERLGYPFGHETIAKNIEYYTERTSHGSTLSAVVHSWVTARADRERSWRLFVEALESDVADVQGGTTAEGIHLGAMAGTIDLMSRGFSGIETREGVLSLSPCLPDELRSLGFPLWYRGHWGIRVTITHDRLRVMLPPSSTPPIRVRVGDEEVELHAGDSRNFALPPRCGTP